MKTVKNLSKKDIIHYADWASKGYVVLTCRFYINEITILMSK